ncbi:MAG: NAD-dependent epimerase/dehydratase family protein [Clostridiales bacterium]|nr:NAD-dependent epimerase/dehydratase family protein [Clostridiales bacterium]
MRVLLIGANGFAGKYLRQELESHDYEVFSVDAVTSDPSVRKVDMLDPVLSEEIIREASPDIIFNLAGQAAPSISWEKVLLTMHLNIDISVNILEAVRKICPKTRVILIGSANQYDGSKAVDGVISEETPLNNTSPYDISKNTQEEIVKMMASRYDLDVIMTRSFNHIGPGQKTGFVVTDYCQRIVDLENGKIDTFTFGNLDSWRDFSDVRDVVRAYRLIAEKGESGEIYNVGSGKSFYIRDIIGKLVEMSPLASSKVTLPSRLDDDKLVHVRADITKLQKATGFEAKCDIFETIKDVLESFREGNN